MTAPSERSVNDRPILLLFGNGDLVAIWSSSCSIFGLSCYSLGYHDLKPHLSIHDYPKNHYSMRIQTSSLHLHLSQKKYFFVPCRVAAHWRCFVGLGLFTIVCLIFVGAAFWSPVVHAATFWRDCFMCCPYSTSNASTYPYETIGKTVLAGMISFYLRTRSNCI